jgi:hypothetical protein
VPGALHIADCFHLVCNATDVLERALVTSCDGDPCRDLSRTLAPDGHGAGTRTGDTRTGVVELRMLPSLPTPSVSPASDLA